MQFTLLATLTALATFAAAAPQTSNCFSNQYCAKPAMHDLCKKAYNKFEDDKIYSKGSLMSASNGEIQCDAYMNCDSSLMENGHIKWDHVSGYDLKFQFHHLQAAEGCTCGTKLVIQPNCWLELAGGKAQ